MSDLEEVIEQARAWDAGRPRSVQKELGWSDMAGCRSYMGFRLREEWATDDEDNWRAIAGTAMHAWMTDVRRAALKQAGHVGEFDLEVSYRGIPGHVDEIIWSAYQGDERGFILTDYKFPSKNSARLWDDPDVLEEKFIQPQGYAAAVVSRYGQPCATVRLLVCPVDGTFSDWKLYERPFDQEAADGAIARYRQVREAVHAGDALPKDKPWFWCERYCPFFRACRQPEDAPSSDEITDPELAAAVEAYGLAKEQHSAADKAMKEIAPLIRGLQGTARGWKISMTRAGAGKLVVDEDAMISVYQEQGWRLPMRSQAGRPASLLVKREKA